MKIVAAMQQSIHLITGLLEHVPSETPFHNHLKKLDVDQLEEKSAAILARKVH